MAAMVGAVTGGWTKALDGTAEAAHRVSVAKNVLLFLLAPLIGLAYIVAFPFVGTAALARALVVRR